MKNKKIIDIKEFEKKYTQAKRIITELREENKNLREINENYRTNQKMLGHELRSPLNAITGFTGLMIDYIESGKEEPEKALDYLKHLEQSAKKQKNILDILKMGNSTKETLKHNSPISLERIATEEILQNESLLKNNQLKLNIHYNHLSNIEPISLYIKETPLRLIWSTLLGNSLNHAPKETIIKQGIKINGKYLEILMENNYEKHMQRRISGENEGIGTRYALQIINTLGGKFSNYSKPQLVKENYEFKQSFGDKKVPEKESDKIWGVKIEIPEEYLTK